jgi:excisionase family DNA binding protein
MMGDFMIYQNRATIRIPDEHENLMTITDVAELLRVSPKTIYNWAYRDTIPRIKLGRGLLRFRRTDILRWIESENSRH